MNIYIILIVQGPGHGIRNPERSEGPLPYIIIIIIIILMGGEPNPFLIKKEKY